MSYLNYPIFNLLGLLQIIERNKKWLQFLKFILEQEKSEVQIDHLWIKMNLY